MLSPVFENILILFNMSIMYCELNEIKKKYQSKFFDPTNKKVIDKMKDMYKGKPIREFVGLR